MPKQRSLQGRTKANTNHEDWWAGGTGPMLVIERPSDTIAPPQDTIDLLEAEFPDRVMAVRVEAAGHALLPEQSERMAEAVLGFLVPLLETPEVVPQATITIQQHFFQNADTVLQFFDLIITAIAATVMPVFALPLTARPPVY